MNLNQRKDHLVARQNILCEHLLFLKQAKQYCLLIYGHNYMSFHLIDGELINTCLNRLPSSLKILFYIFSYKT